MELSLLKREIVRRTCSNVLSNHNSLVVHTQDDSPQLPALSLELSHDVDMSALGRKQTLESVQFGVSKRSALGR